MDVTKDISFNGHTHTSFISEPSTCPLCKATIHPVELGSEKFKNNHGNWFISFHYLCKHCYQSFVSLHSIIPKTDTSANPYRRTFNASLIYTGPQKFEPQTFPTELDALNSDFQKVYNEAWAAENEGLLEICGMGYRKALEFLIRDFLLHLYPSEEESMKGMRLGKLINDKVPIEKIKNSAKACAYLGNDHTHYYKKHEQNDLLDLKKLFNSVVYWVAMELSDDVAIEIANR